MKTILMKYLMVSCRQATFLMAKKEESKLSFRERAHLSAHTTMCSLCRRFEKQSYNIGQESRHLHAEGKLSASAKERIAEMLAGN